MSVSICGVYQWCVCQCVRRVCVYCVCVMLVCGVCQCVCGVCTSVFSSDWLYWMLLCLFVCLFGRSVMLET